MAAHRRSYDRGNRRHCEQLSERTKISEPGIPSSNGRASAVKPKTKGKSMEEPPGRCLRIQSSLDRRMRGGDSTIGGTGMRFNFGAALATPP